MKNIRLYLIATLFAGFISCNDVLDKKPLDIISELVVWNDPNLADSYLAKQYAGTIIFQFDRPHANDYWGTQFGQLAVTGISDEAGRFVWGFNIHSYKAGGLNIAGGLLEWWDPAYAIIRDLNILIEKLPETANTGDFIAGRVAEARFLRAFNYFALVKRYGGVPLVTKASPLNAPEEDMYPRRNTEQEIYDFIISEIDAIEEDLKGTSEYGRATQGAALALKCRAALYAGSIAQFGRIQLNGIVGIPQDRASYYYQHCYDAAHKIMNECGYKLYDEDADKVLNFKNVFLKERNSEMIFAKQFDATQNSWMYGFLVCPQPHGWGNGMTIAVYLEMAEEFEHVDGTPGTLDRAAIQQGLWSMEELWGNKDPRFFASIWTNGTPWKGGYVNSHRGLIGGDGILYENQQDAYNGVAAWGNQHSEGNFGTSFGVLKLLNEASNTNLDQRDGTDCPVFRYGEVLLNLAEAAFELGKTDEALDAVNQIRDRAGIARKISLDREAIRHERKVELAFEGHRYWDVRRWRIAVDKLSQPGSSLRYILDYTTGKYQLKVYENYDGTSTPPRFYEQNYYLPITLSRTGANANLAENPGY
jgi:hypothetical protein